MSPFKKQTHNFPSITNCPKTNRENHTVAADLDGTLLISRSSFPYFFLLAFEAGSVFRAATLLLLSPLILIIYKLYSEALGIQMLIYISIAGLKLRDVELAARAVLPRFYASDVRAESWEVFRACGKRRVLVTANPRIMVETFAKEQLGVDKVLGTELEVDEKTGRVTGKVAKGGGVLVGWRKREAVEREFATEGMPELGLGDRETDHDFMALCKEAYMVPPNKHAPAVSPEHLHSPIIFHDGRLAFRPDPLYALLVLIYLPFAFFLALFRIFFNLLIPVRFVQFTYKLTGIRVRISGNPPPPPSPTSGGSLIVCNHRIALDPILISIALGRNVSCVTYSVSRFSTAISPIRNVPLTRDRDVDAARITELLKTGDLVICPEGTTCREPFLLRFSALFAELSDKIVPVAVNSKQNVFIGTTVRGFKFLDPYFFYMNPIPEYEVKFLEPLKVEETCKGGRTAIEVANDVQRRIGEALGFKCTTLTRKDKYMKLGGNDGKVVTKTSSIKKID